MATHEQDLNASTFKFTVAMSTESIHSDLANSSKYWHSKHNSPMTYVTSTFCVFIFVIGVVGNSLVLAAFSKRWKERKMFEILIMNLAAADLIGTIILPSTELATTLELSFYPIRDSGCKILTCLSVLSISLSSFTLVVISADRYLVVKWPLQHDRLVRKKIHFIIVGLWLASFALGGVYLFGDRMRLSQRTNYTMCRDHVEFNTKIIHMFTTIALQKFLPMLIVFIFCALIIYELRKNAEKIFKLQGDQEIKNLRLKQNRKAAKLLVVIVLTFYVCTIPISVFYILYVYRMLPNLTEAQIAYQVYPILVLLQMFNSCLNPLIYSKLLVSFKRSVLMFLSCFHCSGSKAASRKQDLLMQTASCTAGKTSPCLTKIV